MNETALQAWEMAAGVSVSEANLAIRTLLLVTVFLWAVWCVYGELHYDRHHSIDLYDVLRKNLRILWVVSVILVLVFVG